MVLDVKGHKTMIAITVIFNGYEIEHFVTEKKYITIGRMSNNDICLNNIGISKRHAWIFEREGVYLLEDCESTNGTYLNGKEVKTTQLLEENDVIGIVKYHLEVSFPPKEDDSNRDAYPNTLSMHHAKK